VSCGWIHKGFSDEDKEMGLKDEGPDYYGKPTGWSTETTSSVDSLYIPLKGITDIVGVLVYWPLAKTEYQLLSLLARNVEKLLTQRQLSKEILGISAIVYTHYLRICIGQLRCKIEKDPSRPVLIITVLGMGYKINIIGKK
jgi:hypothetical protein